MKTNLIRLAVVAALASVSAVAQTVSYTQATAGGNTLVPGTGAGTLIGYSLSVSLPQWNPSLFPGATLTGVQYQLSGEVFGRTFGTNPNAFPVNFTFSLTAANFSLTGPFGTSPAISGVSALTGLGAAPQISTGAISPGGSFGPSVTALGTGTSSLISDAANLSSYIGTGSVSFGVAAASSFDLSGVAVGAGGEIVLSAASSTRGASTVTVTYTFSEVPEPSTYAAIGFAGLVAGATVWRRRQVAKVA